MTPLAELCPLDQLLPGSARGFDPGHTGSDTLFAVRRGLRVRIYRNDCPHQHRPLNWRKDGFLSADGAHIVCFAHNAVFDIDTGRCLVGPCHGRSLSRVPHFVKGGVLYIATADIEKEA